MADTTLESLDLPTHRNISNSEVTAFLSCTQMYDFAFMRNLAPKVTPKPLARGTLGHLAFQYYIEGRLEGLSHAQSLQGADRAFNEAMDTISMDIVMQTKFLFTRYMEFHNGWPEWELLGTEQSLVLKVTDEITIPIRYDLMVRELSSNRILVGDFKFSYDFWRPIEHSLNAQMPKYVTIMQANGIKVAGGFLEEIRTRPLGAEKSANYKNLWKRSLYFPTHAKKRNTMKQHIATSLKIMEYRALPDAEREMATIPLLNKFGACKVCNFAELCASKLDGADIEHFIATAFVPNTYGYNDTNILIEES
jgi:hypothetical protein